MPRHASSQTAHVSRGKTIQYLQNRILSALPLEEFQRLSPHLTKRPLKFRQSLSKPSAPITQVCFRDSGVCSVMSVMRSGAAAEVGTVGNEGVTGLALFYGDTSEPTESIIQVPGVGRLLPADVFQQELAPCGVLSIGCPICARAHCPSDAIGGMQCTSSA